MLMPSIEFFDDTINPFDIQTAKQFVYDHRNVFAAKNYKRLIPTGSLSLIVVKEISISPDYTEKTTWFWFFTPSFRGILEDPTNRMKNNKALEIIEKAVKNHK